MRLWLAVLLLGCSVAPEKAPRRGRAGAPGFITAAGRICQAFTDCEPALGRYFVSQAACVDLFLQDVACDGDFHVSADALEACEEELLRADCDAGALSAAIASDACIAALTVAEEIAGEG